MGDGDFDDFELSFRRLYPQAARLAYRIVGNRESAEDVAAEACARALARWRHVGRLAHREAWVLRVASNLALDTVKRKAAPSTADVHVPDAEDSVVVRLALGAALRALPRRQREVIVLRYLVGLPDSEVADALGIAEGTVRTHVRRALSALRVRGLVGLEDAAL
jgi:RNA polymerase sigma-70 factor (ECF subfamily)